MKDTRHQLSDRKAKVVARRQGAKGSSHEPSAKSAKAHVTFKMDVVLQACAYMMPGHCSFLRVSYACCIPSVPQAEERQVRDADATSAINNSHARGRREGGQHEASCTDDAKR